MEQLKEYLRRLNHQTVAVVCHSDVIWWLTSEVKSDGNRYGTHPKNGEIVDITEFVLLAENGKAMDGSARV